MNTNSQGSLTNGKMVLQWDVHNGGAAKGLSLAGESEWLHNGGSPEFAVIADGERIDALTEGVIFLGDEVNEAGHGSRLRENRWRLDRKKLTICSFTKLFPEAGTIEKWLTVTSDSDQDVVISRMDSISYRLKAAEYELMYYTSDWGQEFESIREKLEQDVVIETRHGRSSKGQHPWFALYREDGGILAGSAMWSGNWQFRFERLADGGYAVSGGLSEWEFAKVLQPGETVESVHVALGLGTSGNLNTVSVDFAKVGRAFWYPSNLLSKRLPVEWNHWWPYNDVLIDEQVFKDNVDAAAELGVEVCTLDAGWFGPSDPSTHWFDYRGDWDLVNTVRFPGGIRALSDYVHDKGMMFGLWCEIEALGQHARLAERHPEFVASRGSERLGYVCMGSPEAQEWAYEVLDRIITSYNCDWIKLDFNLDPGAGCSRTDHGHGAGDGLYAHYSGYYAVLERIRATHPEVVLENCASGGLRIDLGLMKQSHNVFLSDPDWPEHSLQLFWGASTMLAPDVCLHWGYSDWMSDENGKHAFQNFDPLDPDMKAHQLDYYIRTGMLGGYGMSQKLPDLPQWVRERFAWNIRLYKEHIRRFVGAGDVRRLTDQPKREGRGDRFAAFQYSIASGDEHLLLVFRLHGAEPSRHIRLAQLDADRFYRLDWLCENRDLTVQGSELMERGLYFDGLEEEDSSVIRIQPVD
ncbi:alpha-galactosidase [Paenibacillus nasutitermitis]|uniref:Alpha-galactosidase n=1 Tax=Paenibacillus nasutitermitis TaxID=1652958 RepID=A0A917DYY8_9BACL|nr:alpha-galactosidase [Paenibacillus nasutitermitis]GGD85709.1 alpha-galactosidase [Paenibacillus nasutitermitis]